MSAPEEDAAAGGTNPEGAAEAEDAANEGEEEDEEDQDALLEQMRREWEEEKERRAAVVAEFADKVSQIKAEAAEFEAATSEACAQARAAEFSASRTAREAKTAFVEDAFVAATAAAEAAEQSSRAATQALETYEEVPDPETQEWQELEEKEPPIEARKAIEQIAIDARACADRAAADAKAAQAIAEEARAAEVAAVDKAVLWQDARKLTLTDEIKCAVVWLHGQGEIEVSWSEMLSDIKVPEEAGACRWLWPRAQFSQCSSRGGAMTLQWFDTFEFPVCRLIRGVPDRPRKDDDPIQLAAAVKIIHAAIAALEAEGIASNRIIVGGFGQGAALAAHTVIRYDRPLAGAAMLSGWIPCFDALNANATESGRTAEILWCHGQRDAMVDPRNAVDHTKELENLGAHVEWRLMPELGSGINPEVLGILEDWLAKRLVVKKERCTDEDEDGFEEGDGDDCPDLMTINENEALDEGDEEAPAT